MTLCTVVLIGLGLTAWLSFPVPAEMDPVRQYLEQRTYCVLSYEGIVQSYQLTHEKLVQMPYMIYWGLQSDDPSPYIGKTIQVVKLRVTNHPLDSFIIPSIPNAGGQPIRLGQTHIFVFLVDHQPVGGTAYPVIAQALPLSGGYWSLDGKTLEEVHDDITYPVWLEAWLNKFKKPCASCELLR